jgi:hypothetical protein
MSLRENSHQQQKKTVKPFLKQPKQLCGKKPDTSISLALGYQLISQAEDECL